MPARKGVPVCDELGANPNLWSTSSLSWPKARFCKATGSLEGADRAAEAGDSGESVEIPEPTRGTAHE